MPEAKIAPSMLASDFANLAAEAHRMTKNGADWLHLGKSWLGCLLFPQTRNLTVLLFVFQM